LKKKYPRNEDIRIAIRKSTFFIGHPHDFPDIIYDKLIEEGFNVSFLTRRRIWRIYEEMVRKGEIDDFLNVVIK